MGGGFALHYALRRPESVRGLVLLSPAGAPIASDHFKAWVSQFDLTTSESAMRFVTKLYTRLPWYAPIVAYECRRLFRRRAIIELVRSFEPDDAAIPEQLQHLTIPIRLIWGGREATLRDEQLAFFKAHLPGHVEFIEPPHFTHCPYLEYPGEVTDLIEGFSVASSRLTEP
jgi:pimeloyl-ACP methyl ester carboxylesterase